MPSARMSAFSAILLALLLAFASSQVSAIDVSACSTINVSGVYELTQSITSAGTCMVINPDDVTLDCKGNAITYNTGGTNTQIGIDAINGTTARTNLTIKNCKIIKASNLGTDGYGIRMTRFSNSYIYNNTIMTNGTLNNNAIVINGAEDKAADRNTIYLNTIYSKGSADSNYGIYIYLNSSYNNITRNSINTTGTQVNLGISMVGSTTSQVGYNIIEFNSVRTMGIGNNHNRGINIGTNVPGNIIRSNYISTNGVATSIGILIAGASSISADNNTIYNNTIITNGTGNQNYGININANSSYNNITANNITVNGTNNNMGIYIVASSVGPSSYNTIDSNTIRTNGTVGGNIGISLNTDYNNITNNNVSTYGTSTNYGISLSGSTSLSSNGNMVMSNNIRSSGTTNQNHGIILASNTSNNNITNNNVSTYGTDTSHGVYLLGATGAPAHYNVIQNNFIIASGTSSSNSGIKISTNANYNNATSNTIYTNGTSNNVGIYISSSASLPAANNTIYTNIVRASGTGGSNYGFQIDGGSNYNNITANTFVANGTNLMSGAYLSGAHNNTLDSNIFLVSGTAANNYAIYMSSAHDDKIINNNITVNGTNTNYGFYLQSSNWYDTIYNNIISTKGLTGSTNRGIMLLTNANYNNITANYIIANGTDTSQGIYIDGTTFTSAYNTVSYNVVKTYSAGASDHGIVISANSNYNNVTHNNITTSGTVSNFGLYIAQSSSTLALNNTISTIGTSTNNNHAIYVIGASYNTTLSNNTIPVARGAAFQMELSTFYPSDIILENNTVTSTAASELIVSNTGIDGITLLNQPIKSYSFTGTGSNRFTVENGNGKISFLEAVNGSGTNLSNEIKIADNSIYVNASVIGLNRSAQMTFYNASAFSAPAAFKDGAVCPGSICTGISSAGGRVYVNVTGWSLNAYSLVEAVAPLVMLIDPSNWHNTSSQSPGFQFQVTEDNLPSSNCSLYLNSALRASNATTLNGTTTSLNASGLAEGQYNWSITCRNAYGASNTSETRNFTIDISSPTVSGIVYSPASLDDVDPGTNVTINATVTDNWAGTNLAVLQYYNGSEWVNRTMTRYSPTSSTYQSNIVTSAAETNYTYSIWTNDSLGNANSPANNTLRSEWDCTWTTSPTAAGEFAGFDSTENIFNLTFVNTGDAQFPRNNCTLNLRTTYSLTEGRVYIDGSYFKPSNTYSVAAKSNATAEINASFLGEVAEEQAYLTTTEMLAISSTPARNTTFALVSTTGGPYLYQKITSTPITLNLTYSNFSLAGYVRNMAGDDSAENAAYNVTFNWTLPTGFLISRGTSRVVHENISNSSLFSNNLNLSFNQTNLASLSPGTFTASLMSSAVNMTGSGVTHSLNRTVLTDTLSFTLLCYNISDGIYVSACGSLDGDYVAPAAQSSSTSSSSSSGGGGGGSAGSAVFSKAEYQFTRGEKDTISIPFANKDVNTTLTEIRVEVSGDIAKYISALGVPDSLSPASNTTINLRISSPTYIPLGLQTITLKITGKLGPKAYIENRIIGIQVNDITADEASKILSETESLIAEFQGKNLTWESLDALLAGARADLGALNYASMQEKLNAIKGTVGSALEAIKIYDEVSIQVMAAKEKSIDVSGTERLLKLAMLSIERQDYLQALERANEAQTSYALETKGELGSVMYYVKNNPQEISLATLLLGLLGFALVKSVQISRIRRNIKALKEEEKILNELIKVVQKHTFKDKAMSMEEYEEAMKHYEKRLAEVISDLIQMETKRIHWLKFSSKDARLKMERQRVVQLIKELQEDYMKKKKIETKSYELRLESYNKRISEIDESLANLEAQQALKKMRIFQ